jgi:hypothetical protein
VKEYLIAILTHWKFICAVGAGALSAVVHGYQIVVAADGWQNILRRFRYGAKAPLILPPTNPPVTPAQPESK